MRVIVTGGAGFIGSEAVRRLVRAGHEVLNIDLLTYAGRLQAVAEAANNSNYRFAQIDVADRRAVAGAMLSFDPDLVLHLAAESHVDRSIDDSAVFVKTNIVGAHVILECALEHWRAMTGNRQDMFRLVLISTDEVFGALAETGKFTEQSAYAPNSPYAASKAAADHLARAWCVTYGLPVIVTNCSNNYGPWQHPEKLIPTIIRRALSGAAIPIYGKGTNVRDWLHVEDHVSGLLLAGERGRPGDRYLFGADAEHTNLEIARVICRILDSRHPRADGQPHEQAITFVVDRPGHDFRYATDSANARRALGWAPTYDFEGGLAQTIAWFLDNPEWFARDAQELARLGLVRTS